MRLMRLLCFEECKGERRGKGEGEEDEEDEEILKVEREGGFDKVAVRGRIR